MAPNTVLCDAGRNDICLIVKRGSAATWSLFPDGRISGYTHEQGFRYRLSVEEQFRAPVTLMGLKEVLEKTPDSGTYTPGSP
ncbi:DUF4377 domain-containing protein [Deinococcus multiflagellatus]|uniref:DUF4377 domain-containing protein n=1 Tax=Deinococcus multiflagellatus TaxID=1656887 RepID=A0ABW1ZKF2_9DEIO|nr:DUF4377 domain-containing protein [Deinococcus multiflagellatus]MBZ9712580.1 DUF4377 domain-containing protein [Deinococcus multiflagellatus]